MKSEETKQAMRNWLLFAFVTLPLAAQSFTSIAWSKLPLRFEKTAGPRDGRDAIYTARGPNYGLFLSRSENRLRLQDRSHGTTAELRTRLSGSLPDARLIHGRRSPGETNYFIGRQEQWRTGISAYESVRYEQVYPGIDLVFHGANDELEYDFDVAPNADPTRIRLEMTGQRDLRIDGSGDLVASTSAGEVRWKQPAAYQEIDGKRVQVAGRFVLSGRHDVRFEIGRYDRSRELIIDPALSYLTYLGGTANEFSRGIGKDAAGNVYVAGNTTSSDLPSLSAYQPNLKGLTANWVSGDAFVAKYSAAGKLLYLTYLGGTGDEGAMGLAIDAAGNAYITGATTSRDFPVAKAFQSTYRGEGGNVGIRTGDAFVAKLNPTGNQLLYSTYLGGSRDDVGMAIAVDSSGNAYVAGATLSFEFPSSDNAYQKPFKGSGGLPIPTRYDPGDAFVAKFDPNGQRLAATLIGGGGSEMASAIAVDSSQNVYIGGYTLSTNFPVTAGALKSSFSGSEQQNEFYSSGDGFLTKFNSNLSGLVYSTYFGGPGDDAITGIALDSSGNLYFTGFSSTTNLPVSAGAFQSKYAGYVTLPFLIEQLLGDAIVGKLNANGSGLMYLSYLGGSNNDAGNAIQVDSAGNAYVTGFTESANFPTAGNPAQASLASLPTDRSEAPYFQYGDAFLTVVNPQGNTLLYSTYLGGSSDDMGFAIAIDGNGKAYISGCTMSANLKSTADAAQAAYGGTKNVISFLRGDGFYAMFSDLVFSLPAIQSINTSGSATTIAANSWTEIKGSGLATGTRIWQGSDFVNGQMPTSLDGTTVTMNGKPAYVYYISPTQVNVLTPPDLGTGNVQVQVTKNGIPSVTYSAQAQQYATSLFLFGAGPYVAATHADGSYLGPTTLYPGVTTPATPGERIVLYGNGFGATSSPIVKGSETQGGTLPLIPVVRIGGLNAKVSFAGLISPGLFQFNVDVPDAAPNGDDLITVTYGASNTTQAGAVVTVQR